MHLRHIPLLEPINRPGQILAKSFVFDGLDRIRVCVEGEDEGFGAGEAMERLAFAAEEGLFHFRLVSFTQLITYKPEFLV